jgi:hypothetical protein
LRSKRARVRGPCSSDHEHEPRTRFSLARLLAHMIHCTRKKHHTV